MNVKQKGGAVRAMTTKHLFSRQAQDARRRHLQLAICEANYPRFSVDGAWISEIRAPGARERCWHCLALLAGKPEHVARANRILATMVPDRNDFMAFFALLLLRLHERTLTEPVRQLLDQAWRANIEHVYDHIWRYTENCSALNCFALLEAGERSGEARYAARVRERLEGYVHQFTQSGVTREFISVNYLPITINGFALVAEYARDRAIRALGRKLEADCWRELAMCWHPHLGASAGPSGRSYTTDSMAVQTLQRDVVWLVLGDRACPSPADFGMFGEPADVPVKTHDPSGKQTEAAWMIATPYHIAPATAALFYQKTLPWQMCASVRLPAWREYEKGNDPATACALGGWSDGANSHVPSTVFHPGGTAIIGSYLGRHYGLGTSSRMIFTQADFLFGIWGRVARVRKPADFRTLYTRFVINDALEENFGSDRFADLLPEQGRGGAFQSGPLAVAWYAGGEVVTRAITRLRTCVLLPTFYNEVDEIVVEGSWVFVRDGPTNIALRPLAVERIEVKRVGRFCAVTGIHYEGPSKDFHPAALRQLRGGVVCILGNGAFGKFRTAVARAQVEDTLYESQRRLRVSALGHEVEVLWDMQTEDLVDAKCDGKYRRELLLGTVACP